jgi:hypothetical protein
MSQPESKRAEAAAKFNAEAVMLAEDGSRSPTGVGRQARYALAEVEESTCLDLGYIGALKRTSTTADWPKMASRGSLVQQPNRDARSVVRQCFNTPGEPQQISWSGQTLCPRFPVYSQTLCWI